MPRVPGYAPRALIGLEETNVAIDESLDRLEAAAKMAERSVSRRDLLKLAGFGAGMAALSPILAACGGNRGSGAPAGGGAPAEAGSLPPPSKARAGGAPPS